MVVRIQLDVPLTKDHYGKSYEVWGFELQYESQDQNEFVCTDCSGKTLLAKYDSPLKVDNRLREQIPALLVDTRRDLLSELRASQWTLLGKILNTIENRLMGEERFRDRFNDKAKQLVAQLMEDPVKELEGDSRPVLTGIGRSELRCSDCYSEDLLVKKQSGALKTL